MEALADDAPQGDRNCTAGNAGAQRQPQAGDGRVDQGTGEGEEDEKLASATRSALALAESRGLRSIAFPAISCGVYGYPIDDACRVAVATTRDFLAADDVVWLPGGDFTGDDTVTQHGHFVTKDFDILKFMGY